MVAYIIFEGILLIFARTMCQFHMFQNFMLDRFPIILIFLNTLTAALGVEGMASQIFTFIGSPTIAVAIGLILAIYTLAGNESREDVLIHRNRRLSGRGHSRPSYPGNPDSICDRDGHPFDPGQRNSFNDYSGIHFRSDSRNAQR